MQMSCKRIIIIVLSIFPFLTIFPQNIQEIIKEGDHALYEEKNYNKALEIFQSGLVKDPNNPQLLNRVSKTIVYIGDNLYNSLRDIETEYRFGEKKSEESLDSSEVKSAQVENYEKALEVADRAIKVDPQNAEGYVRRAIANARIAVTKGIFSVASVVNKVKEDLEFAILLGTGGTDIQAVAHYVLAKTHDEVSEKWAPARKLIGLGWGDIKIALKEYQKAIELKSDVIMFYYDYAKALLEEDYEDIAIKMLEKINECKELEPQDKLRIKEAHELLTSLK